MQYERDFSVLRKYLNVSRYTWLLQYKSKSITTLEYQVSVYQNTNILTKAEVQQMLKYVNFKVTNFKPIGYCNSTAQIAAGSPNGKWSNSTQALDSAWFSKLIKPYFDPPDKNTSLFYAHLCSKLTNRFYVFTDSLIISSLDVHIQNSEYNWRYYDYTLQLYHNLPWSPLLCTSLEIGSRS